MRSMPGYDYHVFVCLNERPADDPRGCCRARGAEELFEYLKSSVKAARLPARIRVNRAGCLDTCRFGPSVVVYPEGTWYTVNSLADVDELVESHLRNGRVVTRLLMPGST